MNDMSWFQIMKNDFEKGNFPKIDPWGFLPPFPAATALQVMATLNDVFQTNKDKVSKLVTITIDHEIAKKKHDIQMLEM